MEITKRWSCDRSAKKQMLIIVMGIKHMTLDEGNWQQVEPPYPRLPFELILITTIANLRLLANEKTIKQLVKLLRHITTIYCSLDGQVITDVIQTSQDE